MGWTSYHLERGQAMNEFKRMLTWETETAKNEMVQGAFASFTRFYAAVKTTRKDTGQSYVWAFVAMIRWSRDYHNFCYKDMDETCGPNIVDCPLSILKLLTPCEKLEEIMGHTRRYAKNWRIACWENVFKNQDKTKLKDGDTIKMKFPVAFQDGSKHDTFVIRKNGRRMSFQVPGMAWCNYRLGNLADREYSVLKAA